MFVKLHFFDSHNKNDVSDFTASSLQPCFLKNICMNQNVYLFTILCLIPENFTLNLQSEELIYEKSDTKGKNGNAQVDGCHFKKKTKELVILHHRKVEGKD